MEGPANEQRTSSAQGTSNQGASRRPQLRADARSFQPHSPGAARGLQGLPKVQTRRQSYVNLDAVPFTPSQGIATPTPVAAPALWYNQQMQLYGDPSSARSGSTMYYWGMANQIVDMAMGDGNSSGSEAMRFNSDSDRSPVHAYSPIWTLSPQAGDGAYMQMPGEGNQHMGFTYGPPAVPFASYPSYHGAFLQLMPAQPLMGHPGHASSSPRHQQGAAGYPPGGVFVAVGSPKAGSPHAPHHLVFHHPGGPMPHWRPPHQAPDGSTLPPGASAAAMPVPPDFPQPHHLLHHPPRRRSHLGQSRSRANSPDLQPYGAEQQSHSGPGGSQWQPRSAASSEASAQQSHAAHDKSASPPRRPRPAHPQQQSPLQQHASSLPDPVGPDGLPMKLNARQRRTLRRAAARAAMADAQASESDDKREEAGSSSEPAADQCERSVSPADRPQQPHSSRSESSPEGVAGARERVRSEMGQAKNGHGGKVKDGRGVPVPLSADMEGLSVCSASSSEALEELGKGHVSRSIAPEILGIFCA
ncbi:hypothetical protein WJX73_007174 [Symbiochloris irregularis]|uniref:Uncharacterized protein n=1 Tax=Symbiochloris irregularis TaxID=706552 RepID=A0AAW1NU35_9CHLO